MAKISIFLFLLFLATPAFASSDPLNPTFFASTVEDVGAGAFELSIDIPNEQGEFGFSFLSTKNKGVWAQTEQNNFTGLCNSPNSGSLTVPDIATIQLSNHAGFPFGQFVDCSASGVYFVVVRLGTPGAYRYYYTQYNWNAIQSIATTAPLNQSYTQIIRPAPYGTTTASTSVNLSIDYKVAGDFNFSVVPPFDVGFQIFDAVTNQLELEYIDSFEQNTAVFFNYSSTTVLLPGSKIMRTYIKNSNTGVDLVPQDETFFNVVNNSYLEATGLLNPKANPADLTQINCSTFDVGCQFQKALTFLLIPSQNVLDRYNSLWQNIQYKVPFGYVTATINQLEDLDQTATPVFDFGDIPFLSTIFSPFKEALALILWGIYAIYFYQHRLTKLDI